MICSLGGSLSHGSPVVVFFDRGHPRFWNFYSTIPIDVVGVKSDMNFLFDPARVVLVYKEDLFLIYSERNQVFH